MKWNMNLTQWKIFCIALLIGVALITSAANNPDEDTCQCRVKLAIEVARAHNWASINFINFLPQAVCVPSPSALLQIFGDLKSYSMFHLPPQNFSSQSVAVLTNRRHFIAPYSASLILLLTQMNEINRFFSDSSWAILFRGEDEFKRLKDLTKGLNIFLNSNFLLYDVAQCQTSVQPFSLYRVGDRVKNILQENGGIWTSFEGFTRPLLNDTLIRRRSDFHGYPMKGVGVAVFPHFTTYTEDGGVSGFVGDLISMLMEAHNFTLTYKVLEGYAYGTLINNDKEANQWTGMVGELQRKHVDFTVSELSITKERTEVVSYTQPLYIISRKMYVGVRVDTRQKLLTYATPMEPLLYVATFIMITILTFSLFLASYLQRMFLPPSMKMDDISLKKAAWYMLSALMQQGAPSTPEGLSTRMIFWYGFMLSFVTYIAYSATLVAQLAVVLPMQLPFENFYGLVEQSGWDAGNVKNDLFEVIASQTCAGDPKEECRILQEVWHNNILRSEGNLVKTYLEGLKRARESKYVFIGVDVTTNNYIKQLPPSEACSIKELPTKYITGGIGIGVQYKSPILPIFDESLQNLKEMGIMEKLVKKWLKVEISCIPSSIVSADLIDVASVFTLLIVGIGGALLVFGIERLASRKRNAMIESTSYSSR